MPYVPASSRYLLLCGIHTCMRSFLRRSPCGSHTLRRSKQFCFITIRHFIIRPIGHYLYNNVPLFTAPWPIVLSGMRCSRMQARHRWPLNVAVKRPNQHPPGWSALASGNSRLSQTTNHATSDCFPLLATTAKMTGSDRVVEQTVSLAVRPRGPRLSGSRGLRRERSMDRSLLRQGKPRQRGQA